MECRSGCAACCIAPSINTPMPNMPNGKKAGEYCANLDKASLTCTIWQHEDYPEHCSRFKADESVCGSNREEALDIIRILEESTQPKQNTKNAD